MANIQTKATSAVFSDNRIKLLNGMELMCYPGQAHASNEENRDLFIKNAFLFYRNASRIFSDSRMFLTPVNIQNGLAYIGAFKTPTLGAYVEWWINCHYDVTKDDDGIESLVCIFAGSPLSGCNTCRCAYPDGSSQKRSILDFNASAKSFADINRRYKEAKDNCEAYSLQEVVDILTSTEMTLEDEFQTKFLIQEGRYNALKWHYNRLEERYESLQEKYEAMQISQSHKDVDDFIAEYKNRKAQVNSEIQVFDEQRRKYKADLKQNLISNTEYQKLLRSLSDKQKDLQNKLSDFKFDRMNTLIKEGKTSLGEIMNRLDNA